MTGLRTVHWLNAFPARAEISSLRERDKRTAHDRTQVRLSEHLNPNLMQTLSPQLFVDVKERETQRDESKPRMDSRDGTSIWTFTRICPEAAFKANY